MCHHTFMVLVLSGETMLMPLQQVLKLLLKTHWIDWLVLTSLSLRINQSGADVLCLKLVKMKALIKEQILPRMLEMQEKDRLEWLFPKYLITMAI
jgi:hypothetical protein